MRSTREENNSIKRADDDSACAMSANKMRTVACCQFDFIFFPIAGYSKYSRSQYLLYTFFFLVKRYCVVNPGNIQLLSEIRLV